MSFSYLIALPDLLTQLPLNAPNSYLQAQELGIERSKCIFCILHIFISYTTKEAIKSIVNQSFSDEFQIFNYLQLITKKLGTLGILNAITTINNFSNKLYAITYGIVYRIRYI